MGLLNRLIVATLPLVPKSIIKAVAQRYIAGPHLEDAVRVSQKLAAQGATTTIDVLGEFVTSRDRAIYETETSSHVLDAIAEHGLNSYLSVKPTSLGLDIDEAFAYENIWGLVAKARAKGLFVRMDMENTPYTERTLNFYRRLRADGFDNVGVVIQAYLHRSESDIRALLEYTPNVRLCKGIYVEDEAVAIKDAEGIRTNYKKLLRILVDGGAKPNIATHDEALIQDAERLIAERKLAASAYEFQMLLGVRDDRRADLIRKGHTVRVYVPFGEDWYGYSTRRLKENPQVAGYVLKALVTGK